MILPVCDIGLKTQDNPATTSLATALRNSRSSTALNITPV